MNRNVEIKAKVDDLASVRAEAQRLAEEGFVILKQEDTFFQCERGRFKLRRLPESAEAELIYYERADAAGPRESRYLVHRTSDPQGLCAALSAALGVVGIVRKRRTLYLIGPTRVHLDEVEGLGNFVELEVVLQPDQDVSDGVAIARDLMQKLGISPTHLIDKAYIDLLDV